MKMQVLFSQVCNNYTETCMKKMYYASYIHQNNKYMEFPYTRYSKHGLLHNILTPPVHVHTCEIFSTVQYN